jgi:hypothetical protein
MEFKNVVVDEKSQQFVAEFSKLIGTHLKGMDGHTAIALLAWVCGDALKQNAPPDQMMSAVMTFLKNFAEGSGADSVRVVEEEDDDDEEEIEESPSVN